MAMARTALSLRLVSVALVALVALGGTAAASAGHVGRSAVPAAQEKVKLTFWDTQNAGVQKDMVEQLAKEFEQQNPGVTIEHKGWTTEDLQKTLPRAVSSGDAPDIAQINNGENSMGPMVRAGNLVPLDKYDAEYGWSKKFSPGLLARDRYTADGKTLGSGVLWGVSQTGEIVGIYYNKKIFADNGVQVPKTFAELESAMKTFKDKGVTPLVFGNLDKWPAIHLFGEIDGTMTSRAYLDGLIYHRGNQSWDTPEIKAAAAKLQDWQKNGYLLSGFEGIGADDAWKLFAAGKGAMLVQGSWQAPDLAKAMGDNCGFFAIPPAGDQKVLDVGGVGIPYGILKTSKNPDMAAKFINFLVSDRAVHVMIEKSALPATSVPASLIKPGTLAGDLYTAWNAANSNDALGHYMDWATPTFYDTLTANLQQLLAGQETPDAFAKALQDDYGKFLSSQK